jgi:hypothetical protein
MTKIASMRNAATKEHCIDAILVVKVYRILRHLNLDFKIPNKMCILRLSGRFVERLASSQHRACSLPVALKYGLHHSKLILAEEVTEQ